ncbi:hypothetical protein EDD85DRAFT_959168 [Armillaria nabsnona]|nr:hypothetical protein EDD85DRAFT_959168 [Armillaria nabsnona]
MARSSIYYYVLFILVYLADSLSYAVNISALPGALNAGQGPESFGNATKGFILFNYKDEEYQTWYNVLAS